MTRPPAVRLDGETPDSYAGADHLAAVPGRGARRLILTAVFIYVLYLPISKDVGRGHLLVSVPAFTFLVAGGATFLVLILLLVVVNPRTLRTARQAWTWLPVILALGIALFLVGTLAGTGSQAGDWITVLAITAAAAGRYPGSIRPVAISAVVCAVVGVIGFTVKYGNSGVLTIALIMPPMAAFFSYTAGKRNEAVENLRQTRAELARIAVSEERLRIARDLHDLLGHSLSLITLKAELARRTIDTDTPRAAREIADLELVARQSLSDVREAVAGYRQPDLAAELAAARQLLAAAGVSVTITAPEPLGLPAPIDAVLAWSVREAVTNIVRHAGATDATITVSAGRRVAVAEITDNGPGGAPDLTAPVTVSPAAASAAAPLTGAAASEPAPDAGLAQELPRMRRTGSGLAGLAERVRSLGGEVAAGQIAPRGFRLRVTIPVT